MARKSAAVSAPTPPKPWSGSRGSVVLTLTPPIVMTSRMDAQATHSQPSLKRSPLSMYRRMGTPAASA